MDLVICPWSLIPYAPESRQHKRIVAHPCSAVQHARRPRIITAPKNWRMVKHWHVGTETVIGGGGGDHDFFQARPKKAGQEDLEDPTAVLQGRDRRRETVSPRSLGLWVNIHHLS